MEFNWEEFISSNNIAVHCKTEEQAKDFCKQMHEHGLKWQDGQSYLKNTSWNFFKKETVYESNGTFASLYFIKNNYTVLEWSDYQKENNMNLELTNLTNEQKQQIIELAKKFEQENEADKLDYDNDYSVVSCQGKVVETKSSGTEFVKDLFRLGLTAHTKEEAEKIRRRLLVEKELRDWAKQCKEPVDLESEQRKYCIRYSNITNEIILDDFFNCTIGNIIFTDNGIGKQAIESIGQERLIRDYFGIDK